MDYVAFLKFKSGASAADRDAALGRRATWQYPDGITMISEYWPMSSEVTVVSIFNADKIDGIFQFELEWNDVFDIEVHPAVSAEDGLRIGPTAMASVARLKQ